MSDETRLNPSSVFSLLSYPFESLFNDSLYCVCHSYKLALTRYAQVLKNFILVSHNTLSSICPTAPDALCLDILEIHKKLVCFRKIILVLCLNKEKTTISKEVVKGKEYKCGQQKYEIKLTFTSTLNHP